RERLPPRRARDGGPRARRRLPVPRPGGVGERRRPLRPVLRARRPAPDPRRAREPERDEHPRGVERRGVPAARRELPDTKPLPELQHAQARGGTVTRWKLARVAPDGTHHVAGDEPLYAARYIEVLAFHEPGLAPARGASGAYHIAENGRPAYA